MNRLECCRRVPPLCKILCVFFPKGESNIQEPTYPDQMIFFYGFTELDTITQDPIEVDYVNSIADVFTNHTEKSSPMVHNADIAVNEFFNPSLKVLFIKVPKAEPFFTTWSEEGNPLQQNQLIDPAFTNNSVIFRIDTEPLFTIYVTRSQTDFVGKLKLSR